jgi:hypothetical protein
MKPIQNHVLVAVTLYAASRLNVRPEACRRWARVNATLARGNRK